MTGALLLLFGSLKVFAWVNQRLVERQVSYEATRVAAGSTEPGKLWVEPSAPLHILFAPLAVLERLIERAKQLLLDSRATFTLFDFMKGQVTTHTMAEIIDSSTEHGISIVLADFRRDTLGLVVSHTNPDGTFDAASPVTLVLNELWLEGATAERVAPVLAHEGWHVTQLFSGISDDFANYPRVVDIEYEAFVAGAAAWDDLKGSQSELTLDAGSGCVAAGEARCKEILATDFGYSVGPRQPSA